MNITASVDVTPELVKLLKNRIRQDLRLQALSDEIDRIAKAIEMKFEKAAKKFITAFKKATKIELVYWPGQHGQHALHSCGYKTATGKSNQKKAYAVEALISKTSMAKICAAVGKIEPTLGEVQLSRLMVNPKSMMVVFWCKDISEQQPLIQAADWLRCMLNDDDHSLRIIRETIIKNSGANTTADQIVADAMPLVWKALCKMPGMAVRNKGAWKAYKAFLNR